MPMPSRPIAISALNCLVALGALARPAPGVTVFDDFGAGDVYDTASGQSVSVLVNVGAPFTPTASASVTDIAVALKATGATTVTFSVCQNTSGHPGAVISSVAVSVAAGDPQVYHATLASPAAVSAGTMYWLRAVPSGGAATWMYNTSAQFGYSATLPTGAWNASNGPAPVMRLLDNTVPPLSGACCAGSICVVTQVTACNALHTHFAGTGVACNAPGNTATPCCKADFDQNGGLDLQDIFDFINAWFASDARTDFDGNGLLQAADVLGLVNAWFAGC